MIIERIFKEVLKHDFNDISDNPDREYMEECAKVDRNRPATWKPYENVPMAIIDMEYNELKNAKTEEDKIENLYHLSVGCLNMWRHLKRIIDRILTFFIDRKMISLKTTY